MGLGKNLQLNRRNINKDKMKKLLLILLVSPLVGLEVKTYIPDDSFESYLEANGMEMVFFLMMRIYI